LLERNRVTTHKVTTILDALYAYEQRLQFKFLFTRCTNRNEKEIKLKRKKLNDYLHSQKIPILLIKLATKFISEKFNHCY